jgi:hypothetical protein
VKGIAVSSREGRVRLMKLKVPNKYAIIAIFLLAAAAVFIAIALISNLGEFITASFVISSMICTVIGIFSLTFSMGEPVDPQLLGLLPAQGCINLCTIVQSLGISGNAKFLPPRVTGETRVMQFNPVSNDKGSGEYSKGSFRKTGPAGIVTSPSCYLLIKDLKKRNALVIPDKEEKLTQLIRGTIEDVFKFAPRVSARWDGSLVTITFQGYPSINSCEVLAQASSLCCTMNPCPMCSLCGVLIAEGIDKVVTLDKCTVSLSSLDVTAVFSILP